MKRIPVVAAGLLALALPFVLDAQTVRWNDLATANWSDEAPRVRLNIEGSRGIGYGGPVLVRFEVSENAYVAVVRVDGEGRMTILYPYYRAQRAAVRGGLTYWVRHPRLGNGAVSFFANEQTSGYVFAIASFSPLDLSRFENRDFDRAGGWSTFTRVNRTASFRPDVYIDRFASAVLWDNDTPYDYDVDYYYPMPRSAFGNALAMCGGYRSRYGFPWMGFSSDPYLWDAMSYGAPGMCRDMYYGIQCLSLFMLYSYNRCLVPGLVVPGQVATTGGGGPRPDDGPVPNEGVVKGGLTPPTPPHIPVNAPEVPPLERKPGRFDQPGRANADNEWDRIMSIPARATRKMKQDDARREATAANPQFDRVETAAGKARVETSNGKTKVADNVERVRTPPPSREPTKVRNTDEPRRTNTGRDFGSTGVKSRTGLDGPPPDRVNRGVEAARPATSPSPAPTLSGSDTEKKKPPRE